MDRLLRLILKAFFLFIFVYVMIGAFIRLLDEETTISLRQDKGISNLPSFTICPYLSFGSNGGYEEFDANKNYSINGFMNGSVDLYDMIDASLIIRPEYNTMLVSF
jgi:hypothetical protein